VTGGVTVVSDDIPMVLLDLAPERRHTDARELLEARRAVEMEIARLASRRASDQDFESMRASIERLRNHLSSDRRVQLHYDHLFHYVMGRAARSDLLAYYQHQILKRLMVILHDYFFGEEDPYQVVEMHERTLEALMGGEETVIDSVMDEHMAIIEQAVALRATRGRTSAGPAVSARPSRRS
jgi:GntR family transcriptional repressor for pyruvate dehydrogenase complex